LGSASARAEIKAPGSENPGHPRSDRETFRVFSMLDPACGCITSSMDRPAHLRLLGPTVRVHGQARLVWLGIAMGCAAVLGMARYLTPNPAGLGTHQQLFGLAPCSFVLTSGLPCPTCGMTTSFAHMMHGHPLAAFKVQPAGAILCLLTAGTCVFGLYVAVSGNLATLNWNRIGPVRLMLAFGLLILGGWAFKIAHGLLTGELPIR
jgi:hypothetical protein